MRLGAKLLMNVFIGPAVALRIPKAWFWSTGDGGRCCRTFYFIRCKGDFSVSWGCHSIVLWVLMNDIINLSITFALLVLSLCLFSWSVDESLRYPLVPPPSTGYKEKQEQRSQVWHIWVDNPCCRNCCLVRICKIPSSSFSPTSAL